MTPRDRYPSLADRVRSLSVTFSKQTPAFHHFRDGRAKVWSTAALVCYNLNIHSSDMKNIDDVEEGGRVSPEKNVFGSVKSCAAAQVAKTRNASTFRRVKGHDWFEINKDDQATRHSDH